MFKRSILALAAVVCLSLPVVAGEIPNPSQPEPKKTSGSTVQGEIPNPSLTETLFAWLASIF